GGVGGRGSAWGRVAGRWGRTSMGAADESQNVVGVRSATTAPTPGTRAPARSSPAWPALVASSWGGMVTIASSAGCCAFATGDPLQGGDPGRGLVLAVVLRA